MDIPSEFVGIPELIQVHSAQVDQFQSWAANRDWNHFHTSHYDWWAFPIDRPSSYGLRYTLGPQEIAELRENPDFMARHLLGAQLLLLSWGWDWQVNAPVLAPGPDQAWANWPIRLEKCTTSMKLMGHVDLSRSCRTYAQYLVADGHSLVYSGRDLMESILG